MWNLKSTYSSKFVYFSRLDTFFCFCFCLNSFFSFSWLSGFLFFERAFTINQTLSQNNSLKLKFELVMFEFQFWIIHIRAFSFPSEETCNFYEILIPVPDLRYFQISRPHPICTISKMIPDSWMRFFFFKFNLFWN